MNRSGQFLTVDVESLRLQRDKDEELNEMVMLDGMGEGEDEDDTDSEEEEDRKDRISMVHLVWGFRMYRGVIK